jgi:hypothetical protein
MSKTLGSEEDNAMWYGTGCLIVKRRDANVVRLSNLAMALSFVSFSHVSKLK